MNCETVREKLGSFVDGELTGDEARHLRRHLDHCSECARKANDHEGIGTILSNDEIGDPPESLKAGIMEEITEVPGEKDRETTDSSPTRPGRSFGKPIRRRLAPAAVLLVGILVGLTVQLWLVPSEFGGPNSASTRRMTGDVLEVRPTGSVMKLLNTNPR